MLSHPDGTNLSARGPDKPFPKKDGESTASQESDEPPFRLPPITAIAGLLLHDWAYKKVFVGTGEPLKGNL